LFFPSKTRSRAAAAAVLLAAALALVGCAAQPLVPRVPPAGGTAAALKPAASGNAKAATPGATKSSPAPGAGKTPASVGGKLTIAGALAEIPTKGRAPKTGYSREQFGPAWSDVDHNGCDTRNDILTRDLGERTYKPGTHECIVLTGVLNDPYTGKRIDFERGVSTSTKVQIDHLVALSNAWQTGAQKLGADERKALANDPMNLLAVDGPTNAGKSDGDAATWLPPQKAFRCSYVARQTAVKLKYGLWMTQGEKAAISRVAATCPRQTVPAS